MKKTAFLDRLLVVFEWNIAPFFNEHIGSASSSNNYLEMDISLSELGGSEFRTVFVLCHKLCSFGQVASTKNVLWHTHTHACERFRRS